MQKLFCKKLFFITVTMTALPSMLYAEGSCLQRLISFSKDTFDTAKSGAKMACQGAGHAFNVSQFFMKHAARVTTRLQHLTSCVTKEELKNLTAQEREARNKERRQDAALWAAIAAYSSLVCKSYVADLGRAGYSKRLRFERDPDMLKVWQLLGKIIFSGYIAYKSIECAADKLDERSLFWEVEQSKESDVKLDATTTAINEHAAEQNKKTQEYIARLDTNNVTQHQQSQSQLRALKEQLEEQYVALQAQLTGDAQQVRQEIHKLAAEMAKISKEAAEIIQGLTELRGQVAIHSDSTMQAHAEHARQLEELQGQSKDIDVRHTLALDGLTKLLHDDDAKIKKIAADYKAFYELFLRSLPGNTNRLV